MAVTITRAQLAVELRIVNGETETISPGEIAVLDRALATATALVLADSPNAPDAVQDSAVVRCAAYLFDTNAAAVRGIQSPLLHSGASALLSRWRSHRLTG